MEGSVNPCSQVICHTTPWGLPVKYIKRKGMKTFYFYVLVNYGSQELEYIDLKDNKRYTVTPGVAHFLEHKIFESKDKNTFEMFSKQSASVNAYTGFSSTVYYFSCTSHIRENIVLMMKLITDTYINKETVEKEKGIITQEIKMYYDNPGWRTFNSFLNSLYKNNTIKYDVAGSVENVESVTPEELLRVYEDFYTSENMEVFVLGDMDESELFQAMDNAPATTMRGHQIKRLYPKEDKAVARAFSSDSMNIGEKLFTMGFKELPSGGSNEGIKKELLLRIIMDYLIGPVSKLYDSLYDDALIDSTFGYGISCGLNFAYSVMSGSGKEPELVREAFFNELKALKASGMESSQFESIKRMLLGESIRLSDKDEAFLKTVISFQNKKQDWFEVPKVLESIKLDEVNMYLSDVMKEESFSMAVTVPLENK